MLADVGAVLDVAGPGVAIGHSAGGHLVLWAAGTGKVDKAVSLAGVTDLARGAREGIGSDAVVEFAGPDPPAHADPMRRLPLTLLSCWRTARRMTGCRSITAARLRRPRARAPDPLRRRPLRGDRPPHARVGAIAAELRTSHSTTSRWKPAGEEDLARGSLSPAAT